MSAQKKIDTIPKELSDQFPAIVKEAITAGLSCEPANHPLAEKSIREIYRLSKLNPNISVFWCTNPLIGTISTKIVQNLENMAVSNKQLSSLVKIGLEGIATQETADEVLSLTKTILSLTEKERTSKFSKTKFLKNTSSVMRRGGQFWISWTTFVKTIMKLGVKHEAFDIIEHEDNLCRSAGWYWSFDKFALICERPNLIKRDEQNRLHNETGPAISYSKGFELFYWHGVSVPKEWILERDKLKPETALQWPNVEQRRAACEILGWNKILSLLRVKIINAHDNPQVGTLIEVNLPDSGKTRFLQVVCGTGRTFALPVPNTTKTALEAQALIHGYDDPSEFELPEVRT